MSKRAVLYARVSSDDRGKDGRNLSGQLEMCRDYAERCSWLVVAELAEDDRGASGAASKPRNSIRFARWRGMACLTSWSFGRLTASVAI
jgi:DNA invertase Pin-like site-specific DNA recombinase